ncbi:MAG: queuosine precursor transporter, partial [Dehalococcoidia bacterium]
MSREGKLILLSSLFVGALLVANFIAVKLVSVGPFLVPAGVIAYPLTFLLTDTIAEVYGKGTARRVVWAGFGVNLIAVAMVMVALRLPPAPFYEGEAAFRATLGMVPRIVLASLVAYLVSQHHDVLAFHFWRRRTRGRYLWFRNNASTIVSQLLDTVLFITIAFAGTMPLGAVASL